MVNVVKVAHRLALKLKQINYRPQLVCSTLKMFTKVDENN